MAYAGVGRMLIRLGEELAPLLLAYYESTQQKTPAAGFTFRRAQVQITRGDGEDVCVNTWDFVNITGGEPDSSWTTTDYETVEDRLITFYTAITSYYPDMAAAATARWYSYPRLPADERPPEKITELVSNLGGIGSDSLPEQCAMTLTKVVAPRRHWGRVYLGPLNTGMMYTGSPEGRYKHDRVDAVAAAGAALVAGCQADDFPMVVYDRAHSALFTVEGVRCDDIPDVQRRRRPDTTPYRKVLP